MKLYYLKEQMLNTLKTNVDNYKEYYRQETNDWIEEVLGENPFLEYKKEVSKVELTCNSKDISKELVENSMKLHKALKNIEQAEAIDERFWAGLSHSVFYEYLNKRIKDKEEKTIKNSYFFGNGKKRSLFTNKIASLWWASEIVYDEKSTNPYRLMRFFENDFSTKILILSSSNFSNNKQLTINFIESLIELEKEGIKIKRPEFYQALKYLNILGGISIIDYLSDEELKNKIKTRIISTNT